ncbi:MAG: hypothetical protein ACAI44_31240 [Candidatus Sericytochromatia bacterium]
MTGLLKNSAQGNNTQGNNPQGGIRSGLAGEDRSSVVVGEDGNGRAGGTILGGVQVQSDMPDRTLPGDTLAAPPQGEGCCDRLVIRVRFGQFNFNPAAPLTGWRGFLKAENAQLRLLHTILYEPGDQVLPQPPDTVGWLTRTKPHYDGFVSLMKIRRGGPAPKLVVHTTFGDRVFTFPELKHLNLTKVVDAFGNQFQIQSYLLPHDEAACADDSRVIQEDPAYDYPDQDKVVVEEQEETDGPATEPAISLERGGL